MGLDSVELLLATEEAFGIPIADSEAEHCKTPRDLIDLLFSKLTITDSSICQSQRAFYLFRRECMHAFGYPRSAITLEERVIGLIPVEAWGSFRDALHALSWPELVAPRPIVIARFAVPFLLFGGSYVLLHLAFAELVLINMLISLIITVLGRRLVTDFTRRYNNLIPEKMTVKDLLFFVMTSDEICWTREQVGERVKKIVIEQLGLSEGEYFEDADFIRDLGMD